MKRILLSAIALALVVGCGTSDGPTEPARVWDHYAQVTINLTDVCNPPVILDMWYTRDSVQYADSVYAYQDTSFVCTVSYNDSVHVANLSIHLSTTNYHNNGSWIIDSAKTVTFGCCH